MVRIYFRLSASLFSWVGHWARVVSGLVAAGGLVVTALGLVFGAWAAIVGLAVLFAFAFVVGLLACAELARREKTDVLVGCCHRLDHDLAQRWVDEYNQHLPDDDAVRRSDWLRLWDETWREIFVELDAHKFNRFPLDKSSKLRTHSFTEIGQGEAIDLLHRAMRVLDEAASQCVR